MNITSKSRYALKIMLDMASRTKLSPIQRSTIAQRQGVPPDYMDQILGRLRDAQLIESIRGRRGGYRLALSPVDISVWDLLSAVEEQTQPVRCLVEENACEVVDRCSSKDAWKKIAQTVASSLQEISLQDLMQESEKFFKEGEFENDMNYDHVIECRGPRKSPGGSRVEASNP